MPIVNPMDALKLFEPAFNSGELEVQRGDIHKDVIVHADSPNGNSRLTYVTMSGTSVTSMALIVSAEFENGKPVFQIGYAVPQHLRKRGMAKAIAKAAVDEFTAGIALAGIKLFYLEAMVSVQNIGSQKVAAYLFPDAVPKEIVDQESGEPTLQYMALIEND